MEIYQLYVVGDLFIESEKPILWRPKKLLIGTIYRSETGYKTLENNQLKEQGGQKYDLLIEPLEDAQIPFRNFKNCLVIRTIALRIDESGPQKG